MQQDNNIIETVKMHSIHYFPVRFTIISYPYTNSVSFNNPIFTYSRMRYSERMKLNVHCLKVF